jgi:glycosyltransferase involved in cell wall biosynthesis
MRLIRPAARWILASLLRTRGSLTIVQNPDDRALLMRSHLPESRIRLIRGAGVDTAVFAPAPEPAGPVCVVLAARMLWDKGVGEFVEAARLIRQAGVQARFALVGDPDPDNPASVPEATLRGWHGQDGVEWWGRRDDMPAVFQAAHIACLPSYYREGLPKVLLEAAACGRPLVATDAPGCREIVHNGDNGVLVPLRDAQALAQAIGTLIGDKTLRQAMGKRAREIVLKDFSSEQVVRETLGVYRELVPFLSGS